MVLWTINNRPIYSFMCVLCSVNLFGSANYKLEQQNLFSFHQDVDYILISVKLDSKVVMTIVIKICLNCTF